MNEFKKSTIPEKYIPEVRLFEAWNQEEYLYAKGSSNGTVSVSFSDPRVSYGGGITFENLAAMKKTAEFMLEFIEKIEDDGSD